MGENREQIVKQRKFLSMCIGAPRAKLFFWEKNIKNENTTVIDNKFCWVFFALHPHISLLKKTFDNESLVRIVIDIIFRKGQKISRLIYLYV